VRDSVTGVRRGTPASWAGSTLSATVRSSIELKNWKGPPVAGQPGSAVGWVALRFGTLQQEWLDHLTLAGVRLYLRRGHFAKGSMALKVQAVVN
jgi:hypothetical protein